MLTVDAVELVTERLLKETSTDLVYSDECTLDTNDVPVAFFSKPDWSPFLLLSCMTLSGSPPNAQRRATTSAEDALTSGVLLGV